MKSVGQCRANLSQKFDLQMKAKIYERKRGNDDVKHFKVIGNIFDEGSENIGKGAEEN